MRVPTLGVRHRLVIGDELELTRATVHERRTPRHVREPPAHGRMWRSLLWIEIGVVRPLRPRSVLNVRFLVGRSQRSAGESSNHGDAPGNWGRLRARGAGLRGAGHDRSWEEGARSRREFFGKPYARTWQRHSFAWTPVKVQNVPWAANGLPVNRTGRCESVRALSHFRCEIASRNGTRVAG